MMDHYEIMHCHAPPSPQPQHFGPNPTVIPDPKQVVNLAEQELRAHVTSHLQHFINTAEMTRDVSCGEDI